MTQKLKKLITEHWDVFSYLFFGVLTTAVNYIIYIPLLNYCKLSGAASNAVAWVGAVIFAYLTNKPWVFKSHDWSSQVVIPELTKFLSCRIGSGILETVIIAITVDFLGWNGNIIKLVTSVLVVVLNYVGSKLLVFKPKN